jgi:hypothetical protein
MGEGRGAQGIGCGCERERSEREHQQSTRKGTQRETWISFERRKSPYFIRVFLTTR